MKKKLVFSLAFTGILSAGCTSNFNSDNDYNSPMSNMATSAHAQSDEHVLASIITLNKNEISAAQEAQKKSSNKAVKQYAALMEKEHGHNLHETQHIAHQLKLQPENGKIATMLHKKGQHELMSLKHLNHKSFDKAYMDDMIKDHSAALELIDHKLLPETKNPLLRKHLEMTRVHVQKHLEKAKQIRREI
jgi:putative membrane protein